MNTSTPATAPRAGVSSVIDFHGIAGLIDTVLEAAPERFPTLLRVLWSSREWLEARVVIDLVARCRDPLAPLRSLCQDALTAASDLDALLHRSPSKDGIRSDGHAVAILNLCDAALTNSRSAARRDRVRQLRPAVKVAAVAELTRRHADIERIKAARDGAIPNLWTELETYVTLDKERRGSRRSQVSHTRNKFPARGSGGDGALPSNPIE